MHRNSHSDQLSKVNQILGTKPVGTNAADVLWCRRPRLYWVSWPLFAASDFKLEDRELYTKVRLRGQPAGSCPPPQRGWKVLPEFSGRFLTLTRALPEKKPGHKLRGLERIDAAKQEVWAAESYRYAPYQYQRGNLVSNGSSIRSLSASERKVIMGFPAGYTSMACPRVQSRSPPA